MEILPPRLEAVAHADALAVSGSRKGGEEGGKLLGAAAALRRRLWRVEHKDADALEAIELFRAAERASPQGACAGGIERALLEGEFRADPAQTYRELYLLRARFSEPACELRVKHALAMLGAFRPLPSVLVELERTLEHPPGPDGGGALAEGGASAQAGGMVVVPTLSSATPSGPARVTSIERYPGKDSARVVVFVTRPTTFSVGSLPGQGGGRGPRLYVDIHDASYRGAKELAAGGVVERVRAGRQKEDLRVVLDLTAPVHHRIFYLPEPFRLVIDVARDAPPRAGAASAAGGARTVRRVVLDPGHGGRDPGAIGPAGLREKDVTLDIAHRAAPLVARELGISTLLTRDGDDTVPLDERTARANAFQADLFVSIHCNASENPASRGVMTFVLDASPDVLASHVAARENAASASAAAELATVMSRVLDADSIGQSVHLAELLQRAAMASLRAGYPDVSDQGVKRAGFYVLAGARMPAVLFETTFISNPVDEARLDSAAYRDKLADSIVNAIRAYRDGH
ncbi:MAG: N-acetylmuramoyl-L-alanine amidase [Sorangiineae bacterium]|nr:N-acetylmuramoyl-L-alanine amidase [Polyangiaceae bacterium]MEB2321992.1 N-acetylmuramoyl-L-alanine amidase [Sorangiineae bacterium]